MEAGREEPGWDDGANMTAPASDGAAGLREGEAPVGPAAAA